MQCDQTLLVRYVSHPVTLGHSYAPKAVVGDIRRPIAFRPALTPKPDPSVGFVRNRNGVGGEGDIYPVPDAVPTDLQPGGKEESG